MQLWVTCFWSSVGVSPSRAKLVEWSLTQFIGSLAQSKSILTHWSRECNSWREAKPYIHLNAGRETVTWLKTRAGVSGVSQMWFNCGAVIGFISWNRSYQGWMIKMYLWASWPIFLSSSSSFFKEQKQRITSIELLSGQVLLFCHCWSSSSISNSWLSSDHKGAKFISVRTCCL